MSPMFPPARARGLLLTALLIGCSAPTPDLDAGSIVVADAGETDAGPKDVDAGDIDAGRTDAGTQDAGEPDGGPVEPLDAGPPGDAGPCGAAVNDAGSSFCRIPVPPSGCTAIRQRGSPVAEMQVSGEPPASIGGWYPAGTFVLTSSTLYTPTCGATGPTGISYSATIFVSPQMPNPSVDRYDVVQTQAGCPDLAYIFKGDTFGYDNDRPWDHLSFIEWTCPPCPDCSTKMKYSGTTTTFTTYLPMEGGATLVQEFTLDPNAP